MDRSIENMKNLIDKLEREHVLSKGEFIDLIDGRNPELSDYLFEKARRIREEHYGRRRLSEGAYRVH